MKLSRVRSDDVLSTCVHELCRAGANPNLWDRDGNRPVPLGEGNAPLHLVQSGPTRSMPNYSWSAGRTSRHSTVRLARRCSLRALCFSTTHCESILELFVRHGADLSARDRDGKTCLDWLRKDGYAEEARKLEALSKEISSGNISKEAPRSSGGR